MPMLIRQMNKVKNSEQNTTNTAYCTYFETENKNCILITHLSVICIV